MCEDKAKLVKGETFAFVISTMWLYGCMHLFLSAVLARILVKLKAHSGFMIAHSWYPSLGLPSKINKVLQEGWTCLFYRTVPYFVQHDIIPICLHVHVIRSHVQEKKNCFRYATPFVSLYSSIQWASKWKFQLIVDTRLRDHCIVCLSLTQAV